jgi:tetratricopeptide (TPR) repeat protein
MPRTPALLAIAIVAGTQQLAAQSKDDVARFDRATTAYYKRADYATAKAILDTLITRDSMLRAQGDTNGAGLRNYGSPYLIRSQARRKLGDTRGAERDLDRALAVTPEMGSRDMVLGYLRQADNDPKGALASFTRAIRADSSDARAWAARGELRLAMKDRTGGLEDMRRAAELGDTTAQRRARPPGTRDVNPMVVSTMSRRADSLEWLGDFTGAFAIYDSVVQMSHWAIAFANRARVQRRLGNNAAALRDFDSALASDPLLLVTRLARGMLRLERGDKRGAQQDLEKVMGYDFNNPHCPECFFQRGMLRIGLGDKEGGMKDVRASADQGWANAQRVVNGLRPVPVESLNAVYALERDGVSKAFRDSVNAADAAAPRPDSRDVNAPRSVSAGNAITSFTNRARPLLPKTLPWLGGLVAFILLFVGALALWLRLTPENRMAEFEFEPGERQLWAGAPVQGLIRLRGSQAIGLAATLVVVGAYLFVQTNGFAGGEGWIFAIPGVPFVLIAMYLLFGRHFVDARRRKMTGYALTNRRAIVSVGRDMQAYDAESLRGATLTEHGDGTGTIVWGSAEGDLEKELERAMASGRSPSSIDVRGIVSAGSRAQRKFDRIAAPRSVFAKVQDVVRPVEAPSVAPAAAEVTSAPSDEETFEAEAGHGSRRGLHFNTATRRQNVLIFGGITAAGLLITYFFGYLPVAEYVTSRSWQSVPCEIVSSKVRRWTSEERDDDGFTRTETNYAVDVTYKYEYAGRRYTGMRYQLAPMSRAGIGAASAIEGAVGKLPVGLASTCWLDPAKPESSVLDRSMTFGTWFGVVPAILVVIGVWGLVGIARKRRSPPGG